VQPMHAAHACEPSRGRGAYIRVGVPHGLPTPCAHGSGQVVFLSRACTNRRADARPIGHPPEHGR
jgi:hypothetical protein